MYVHVYVSVCVCYECRELIILPLYAALSPEQQAKVFKKPSLLLDGVKQEGGRLLRKCVIATNIAETSITGEFSLRSLRLLPNMPCK